MLSTRARQIRMPPSLEKNLPLHRAPYSVHPLSGATRGRLTGSGQFLPGVASRIFSSPNQWRFPAYAPWDQYSDSQPTIHNAYLRIRSRPISLQQKNLWSQLRCPGRKFPFWKTKGRLWNRRFMDIQASLKHGRRFRRRCQGFFVWENSRTPILENNGLRCAGWN